MALSLYANLERHLGYFVLVPQTLDYFLLASQCSMPIAVVFRPQKKRGRDNVLLRTLMLRLTQVYSKYQKHAGIFNIPLRALRRKRKLKPNQHLAPATPQSRRLRLLFFGLSMLPLYIPRVFGELPKSVRRGEISPETHREGQRQRRIVNVQTRESTRCKAGRRCYSRVVSDVCRLARALKVSVGVDKDRELELLGDEITRDSRHRDGGGEISPHW